MYLVGDWVGFEGWRCGSHPLPPPPTRHGINSSLRRLLHLTVQLLLFRCPRTFDSTATLTRPRANRPFCSTIQHTPHALHVHNGHDNARLTINKEEKIADLLALTKLHCCRKRNNRSVINCLS